MKTAAVALLVTWTNLVETGKRKGIEMRIHENTISIVESIDNEVTSILVMKFFYDNCYRAIYEP